MLCDFCRGMFASPGIEMSPYFVLRVRVLGHTAMIAMMQAGLPCQADHNE
jgi:hypothetical protein